MKKNLKTTDLIPNETIESKILLIRGRKVMLDRDLAALYSVETRTLNQAVRRNAERFPKDFMFQLTKKEFENWKSQIVISNREKMGLRRMPYAFTEQGVAMLSSVLNSQRAILVNIQIMRTFVSLKRMVFTYEGLRRKIDAMEKKYDGQFQIVFSAIKRLMEPPPEKPKRMIGFHHD
ncbi:MAG: ORF6N domain-containing protein [Candidatus Omnitrophota bacterium]